MNLPRGSIAASELEGFRHAQRVAYDCAENVAAQLVADITEQQAAEMMREYLTQQGIAYYFHAPFAWFGDRTALAVGWEDADFQPSTRRLKHGMPVILDVAPIVAGYAADIGYTFSFGANPETERLLADLESYRDSIPLALDAGRTMQQIYQDIDARIVLQGYTSSHHAYPAGVIAHRVSTFAPQTGDEALAGGFGTSAFKYLRDKKLSSASDPSLSPFWNGHDRSAYRPEAGLWAVEPHFACGGIGVKFEELLVVTDTDAYWLDDELPHVQRWRQQRRTRMQSDCSATV